MDYINWFSNFKAVLHTCNKLHFVMVYNFFYMLLDWFANILLIIFVSM